MMRKTPDFYATFLHHWQTKPPTFHNADGFEIYENMHKSTNFLQIHKFGTHISAPLHRAILLELKSFMCMETENVKRETINKYYADEDCHRKNTATKGEALGIGIPALVLGGLSALALWGNRGFGGNGAAVAENNRMWEMREKDIAEKHSLYQHIVDSDFGLYKSTRDGFDMLSEKLNASAFGLYKEQRDSADVLANRIAALEKQVAVNEAIRPYQDRLLQCEIGKAYDAAINHADRLDCRNIKGVVTLPSTPTVTGFQSYRCCPVQSSTTPTT